VFGEEFVGIDLTYFIPRILTVADMPHLLAHIAPRPLFIANPVDGRHRSITMDDAGRQMRYTAAVYEVMEASDKLQVSRDCLEVIAKTLADEIRRAPVRRKPQ
jgi:hypothetical protein